MELVVFMCGFQSLGELGNTQVCECSCVGEITGKDEAVLDINEVR